MKNNRKETFLEDFLTTILEIIEDKPLYTIPIGVYCILIQIYHHQNGGYFLSTFEAKPMDDQKMAYVAHINEVAPGTFLCYFKGNDVLTLFVFGLLNSIMYFYYAYLFFLTWARRHHQELIDNNKKIITSINRVLNSFFTLYWWIFYTPYIEINSGVLVTGANSFLTSSRTDMGDVSYENKPKYLMILASLGLILTITTCMIIIFFFRNYEFHETNLLKRRYNTVLIGLVFTRFMLTFFYYLNFPIVAVLKHYIAQVIGILAIYDHIVYLPFKDRTVSHYYGASTWLYYVMTFVTNIWMLTDKLPPVEHFYLFLIVSSLGGGLIIQIQNLQTDVLKKIEISNFGTYYKKFDYYLEELMRLALNSTKDEQEKYQVLQLMQYHRQTCNDPECICQETTFVDFKNDINIEQISQFIIIRFKWAINSQIVLKNNEEFEHLSLKYISFLAKYKNNSPRAYNELKGLTSKRKNVSIYFKTLSNILSKSIEFIMKQTYVRVQQEMSQKMKLNEELQINELLLIEEFKEGLVNPIKEYCQRKIDFWQKLRSGFTNFDQLKKYTSSISQFGIQISEKYRAETSKIASQQIKNNCLYYKVKTIYQIIVANELSNAFKEQAYLKDLLKRDDLNRFDLLSNSNLLSGNIDYIIVSVSKDRGKMLQKPSEKLSRFFDYNIQDFQQLSYLKSLLPPFIGKIHNQLIENMLTRGYSSSVSSVINSFGLSKFGFIFPMNIYINHVYGKNDDFAMHGTILKMDTPNQYLLFDNTGNILGITYHLFMKIFDEDQENDEDFEYNIYKLESVQKTQIQQKIKQFVDKINVQFILPQIAKLIQAFSNQIDKEGKKTQMKTHTMVNGYHIRLKMPRNLNDLVQSFKRKQFNFSRSLKSCRSNVSVTQYENASTVVDLLNHINTEIYTDFISESRDYYIGDNCLNDFDMKVQLHYNELVFGEGFGENFQYYQLTVTEMNRIKEKNQVLHLNTLYPKTVFSTNQYNSGSFPNWINNNNVNNMVVNNSPNAESLMNTSNHGFPVQLFNAKNVNPNQILNDSLLQSQHLQQESPSNANKNNNILDNSHQPEAELDRSHQVDNSRFMMLGDESKINEQGFGFGKQGYVNQLSATDRNLIEFSNTNRNRTQSIQNLLIQESERPFQQKPGNDPYLNPKQQLVNHSDLEIVSPTQQSVDGVNNKLEYQAQELTGRERDNSIANQSHIIHNQSNNIEEVVKEREESQEDQAAPNQQQKQQFYSNTYQSFTLHEVKKSIWEKRTQGEQSADKGKEVHDQHDQGTKNTYEDIFGTKEQVEIKKQGNEEKENAHNSIKSLSESDQLDRRFQINRLNTNSKQSTKSKMKKDDNKNSVASSQQSMRFDNDIIKDMINTKKMPRAFQQFLILSSLFPPVLIVMSIIYVFTVSENYQQSITEMDNISNIQYLSTNYARSAQNQLASFLMQADQFTPSSFTSQYQGFFDQDLKETQLNYQNQLIDFGVQIDKRQTDIIIGSSNEYEVLVSQNTFTNQISLSYPQFIQFSFNYITSFIDTPPGAKTEINSFQFLTDNFPLNIKLHRSLYQSQYDVLTDQLNGIEVLQIPQIINLHKYQEKVFLLVTRIYDFETLKEITKLTQILDILKHPQQGWMKSDFARLVTKEVNLNQTQKRTGKQVVLSSQIFDQKIRVHKSLIQILILFILAQIYYGASIIVVSKKQTIIKDSFIVNKICQESNLAMNSFVFSSEILVFEDIIREKFADFNILSRNNFLELQKEAKVDMSQFTSNLQDTLKKFDIFDSNTLDKVNQLVKNDICSVLTCPDNLKTKFTNGIVGVIQQQLNLVASQDQLTQNTVTPTNRDQILTYLMLPEQQDILFQGFYIPLQSMEKLITYFTEGNRDAINSVVLFIQIYLIVLGIFVVGISIYITSKLKNNIRKQICEINFLLTFIPHEKMTEEATIHMLKSLSNCY